MCVKGLTQLHDGGRIPVVTVQNTGAKAYDGAFFSFFFFGVAFHIKENKWQGSNGFSRAIVYLKDLAVNVHSVTKPRLPSKKRYPTFLFFSFLINILHVHKDKGVSHFLLRVRSFFPILSFSSF